MNKMPFFADKVTFVGVPVPSEGLFFGMSLHVREALEDGYIVQDPHDKHMRWNVATNEVHIEPYRTRSERAGK